MKIDARNLTCPKPVVLTLEALPKLVAGESLEVVVNDSVALGNLTRLAAEKNCDLTTAASGDETTLTLTPRGEVSASENAASEAQAFCDLPATGASVIAESLEDIKELESRGTQILTCGTCLDFYGIREKLAVGGVTNLYEIAKVMAGEPGVTTL